LLEITSVLVGAGAGLRTFWAWVRPGPLPRLWALSHAARSLVTVAIGLVPLLLIYLFVVSIVAPNFLPPAVRIGFGISGWLPCLCALSHAARSFVTVAIGLVPVLLISGFVEAFVTPSSLPPAVRIGLGTAVWLAFLLFMLGRGRQVHRAGVTGDLSEELVGARVATAG